MDCSWGEGNNACDGGESERAYRWIIKSGCIPTSVSYRGGQYLMQVYIYTCINIIFIYTFIIMCVPWVLVHVWQEYVYYLNPLR